MRLGGQNSWGWYALWPGIWFLESVRFGQVSFFGESGAVKVKSRETRKTLEKRGRGGRKEGENAEGGGVGLGCWVARVTGWVWGVVGSLNPRKAQKNALSPPGLRLLVVGLAGTGNPGFRSAGVGACY